MNFNFKPRKRRGLSSVVGTLFFIVLMVGAFTALLAAFSYQNTLIDTQKTIADQEIAKARENFSLDADILTGNLLGLNVTNKGTNPVEVANVWMIEKSDDYEAFQYDVGDIGFTNSVVPVASTKNVAADITDTFTLPEYTVKVVTKLGTVVTADIPQIGDGPPGEQGDEGLACWDINENGVGDDPLVPPVTIDGVTYTTEDTDGDGFFTAIDCAGQNGTSDTIVLEQDLLNKPEIFMIFPSPFGTEDNTGTSKGTWGVTVANPSDVAMTVNKVVITALPTSTQSSETVFPSSGTSGSWTFKGNQIYWYGTPTVISARSATTFMVSVTPSSTIPADQSGLPVFANVQTSFGQFGKTSYLSSIIKPTASNRAPIVSVYRADVANSLTSVKGTWDLNGGNTYSTYITLGENNTATTASYIKSAGSVTHVIINVPKTFTVVSATSSYFTIPAISPNPDGSTQVIAKLDANIGDASTPNAKSIQLTVTAPDLAADGETDPKLYVMYLLADGEVNSQPSTTWEIGPIDEVVIKVTP